MSPPEASPAELDNEQQACDPSNSNNTSAPERRRRKKRVTPNRSQNISFEDAYTLTDEKLGEGAYAVVKTAIHNAGYEVAVKIIEKHPGFNRQRIFKEVDMYRVIGQHENITRYLEFFESPEYFHMVYEKVNGGPLLAQLQRKQHFTERDASHIIRDIARGLDHLHKHGIAHRDLKPDNVLCTNQDTLCPIKVCDFDLGSGITFHKLTSTPVLTPDLYSPVGSAEYMAPEVVENFITDIDCAYDKRCDLWSLGVLMYIVLCGYPPFYGDCGTDCGWNRDAACFECKNMVFNNIISGAFNFPKRDWGQVSVEAKELINFLLKKRPDQRATAEEVLEHAWIQKEGSDALLSTPDVLRKNDSAAMLSNMADSAINLNRVVVQQFDLNVFQQDHSEQFALTPPSQSSLMQRRRLLKANSA